MKNKDEVIANYVELIVRIDHQLDALIYELENEALHNEDLRAYSIDMAMDSVPLIRHLKEAKKHALFSIEMYQRKLK